MVNSFLLQKILKKTLRSFPMHRKITCHCNYAYVPDYRDAVPLENKMERGYIKYTYITCVCT